MSTEVISFLEFEQRKWDEQDTEFLLMTFNADVFNDHQAANKHGCLYSMDTYTGFNSILLAKSGAEDMHNCLSNMGSNSSFKVGFAVSFDN